MGLHQSSLRKRPPPELVNARSVSPRPNQHLLNSEPQSSALVRERSAFSANLQATTCAGVRLASFLQPKLVVPSEGASARALGHSDKTRRQVTTANYIGGSIDYSWPRHDDDPAPAESDANMPGIGVDDFTMPLAQPRQRRKTRTHPKDIDAWCVANSLDNNSFIASTSPQIIAMVAVDQVANALDTRVAHTV